jgi:hypothetical protein
MRVSDVGKSYCQSMKMVAILIPAQRVREKKIGSPLFGMEAFLRQDVNFFTASTS